jgi:alpha-beta hydrolase superfamily lysophospholipase
MPRINCCIATSSAAKASTRTAATTRGRPNNSPPGGSQLFHDKAGSKDKTLDLYEGHVHGLLNDIGKDVVVADIKRWIAARLAAA